jgi:branched-chain amino acid transport system ATP-binding protein
MAEPILEIAGLNVRYGQSHILQGVDLTVGSEPLALLGRNGMGKTTLCNAIVGLAPAFAGSIRLRGVELTAKRPHEIARSGIGYVPQGRRVFQSLSVEEHLRMVAGAMARVDVKKIYDLFPPLATRRRNGATSSPAASSRCSPSPAPCCSTPACWSWTSRPRAWRRSSWST